MNESFNWMKSKAEATYKDENYTQMLDVEKVQT
jgi:hypothetical protein